jgi:hypothetical protein
MMDKQQKKRDAIARRENFKYKIKRDEYNKLKRKGY